jgi:hypothetical protein
LGKAIVLKKISEAKIVSHKKTDDIMKGRSPAGAAFFVIFIV